MTLKNAVTKGVKAWRVCIDPKTGEYYLLTSAALAELNGLKAMYRLPAVYYRIVLTRELGLTSTRPPILRIWTGFRTEKSDKKVAY